MTALNRFARAVSRDVRSRPIGYGVLAVFTLGGPLVANLIFPEAPLGVGVVGGLALGAYAALSAVPDQFL
jgi:multidrug efflux pump subunit AcrB